jgi:hypothetical protein
MQNFNFTTIVPFKGEKLKMEIIPVFYSSKTLIEKSLNDQEFSLEPGYYARVFLDKKLSKEDRLEIGIIKAKDNRNATTYLILSSISQSMDELVETTYHWIRETEVELISASNKSKSATSN